MIWTTYETSKMSIRTIYMSDIQWYVNIFELINIFGYYKIISHIYNNIMIKLIIILFIYQFF